MQSSKDCSLSAHLQSMIGPYTQRLELSLAYDINPTLSDSQSLLINRTTSESDLNILLALAGDYMLSTEKAKTIIDEVKSAMKSWRSEARKLGLPQRDIDLFARRFDSRLCQN